MQPYIAVIGPPLSPVDHKVVVEKTILLKGIDHFEDAIVFFMGLIFVLNLQYNARNTYDFLQQALLQLDHKITSKKATSLLAKLI